MDWAMKEKRYSQRRACALAGMDPRVCRRVSKRPADTELWVRMKELASERRRFRYRRLHILLKREGWHVNWKKLYRIYREEGLTVRKITEEDIDTFEEPYFEMLDMYFENEDEEVLESFCDQPNLTQFMGMEISTEDEDGTSLDDETATQLFIVTLAMITLMGRAINPLN